MLITNYAIKFRIPVVVLMLVLVLSGVTSYVLIPRELAPDITIPFVFVTAAYEGTSPQELSAFALSPGLRRVVDRCLERTAALLAIADPLPAALADWRLAAQAAVTLSLAKRLQRRLEKGDSLAGRIKPSRADFLKAGAVGLLRGGLRL